MDSRDFMKEVAARAGDHVSQSESEEEDITPRPNLLNVARAPDPASQLTRLSQPPARSLNVPKNRYPLVRDLLTTPVLRSASGVIGQTKRRICPILSLSMYMLLGYQLRLSLNSIVLVPQRSHKWQIPTCPILRTFLELI